LPNFIKPKHPTEGRNKEQTERTCGQVKKQKPSTRGARKRIGKKSCTQTSPPPLTRSMCERFFGNWQKVYMQMVKDPFNSQKHIPCKDVLSNTNNLEMMFYMNSTDQTSITSI